MPVYYTCINARIFYINACIFFSVQSGRGPEDRRGVVHRVRLQCGPADGTRRI